MTYYQATVKVKIEDDNGKMKKHTEQYLVDAVTVTDVEVKVTEEYKGFPGEWELQKVSETKILKILN
jgi:hypothetical protein